MIITLKIDDINPRRDTDYVARRIIEYLNQCDPQDRPDLRITRPLRGTHE